MPTPACQTKPWNSWDEHEAGKAMCMSAWKQGPEAVEKNNKLVQQCRYLHEKQSPETVEKINKLVQHCRHLPRKQSPGTVEMTIKLVQQCTCLHKKQSPETDERECQASTAMHKLAQSVSMFVWKHSFTRTCLHWQLKAIPLVFLPSLPVYQTNQIQCQIVFREVLLGTEIPEGGRTMPNTTLSPPQWLLH